MFGVHATHKFIWGQRCRICHEPYWGALQLIVQLYKGQILHVDMLDPSILRWKGDCIASRLSKHMASLTSATKPLDVGVVIFGAITRISCRTALT